MLNWEVLRDREIINLIIGDKSYNNNNFIELSMPYMSGKEICDFSRNIGFEQDYSNKSRWMYMDELLEYIISNNQISVFFNELIELKRFRKNIYHFVHDQNYIYYETIYGFFTEVNNILFYDHCYIDIDLEKKQYNLVSTAGDAKIISAEVKRINVDYVNRLSEEIHYAIACNDYESAISKSRTLLEEIMIYGLEQKKIETCSKGNIIKLYGEFKTVYKMKQDGNLDKNINNLISGLNKIVESICNIRDFGSDSHGKGSKRYKIEKHHALLVANSSITLSNFLITIIEKNNNEY